MHSSGDVSVQRVSSLLIEPVKGNFNVKMATIVGKGELLLFHADATEHSSIFYTFHNRLSVPKYCTNVPHYRRHFLHHSLRITNACTQARPTML